MGAGELENGVAGDAGEDHAVERWGDEFEGAVWLAEDNEEVHGADFGEMVLGTVEPQVLHVANLGGFLLRVHARGVVCSEFVLSGT